MRFLLGQVSWARQHCQLLSLEGTVTLYISGSPDLTRTGIHFARKRYSLEPYRAR
jgi:hypothetical protein